MRLMKTIKTQHRENWEFNIPIRAKAFHLFHLQSAMPSLPTIEKFLQSAVTGPT